MQSPNKQDFNKQSPVSDLTGPHLVYIAGNKRRQPMRAALMQLKNVLGRTFQSENWEFLRAVNDFELSPSHELAYQIFQTFIGREAEQSINIDHELREDVYMKFGYDHGYTENRNKLPDPNSLCDSHIFDEVIEEVSENLASQLNILVDAEPFKALVLSSFQIQR